MENLSSELAQLSSVELPPRFSVVYVSLPDLLALPGAAQQTPLSSINSFSECVILFLNLAAQPEHQGMPYLSYWTYREGLLGVACLEKRENVHTNHEG